MINWKKAHLLVTAKAKKILLITKGQGVFVRDKKR